MLLRSNHGKRLLARAFGLPARKGWAFEKTRYRLAPTVGSLETLSFRRLRHSLCYEIMVILPHFFDFVNRFLKKNQKKQSYGLSKEMTIEPLVGMTE